MGPTFDRLNTDNFKLHGRPPNLQGNTPEEIKQWAELQRAAAQYDLPDKGIARATAKWTATMMNDWTNTLRDREADTLAHLTTGYRLATIVGSYLQCHFH